MEKLAAITKKNAFQNMQPLRNAEALRSVIDQAASPDANVLLFVAIGNGPEKYHSGEYGELVQFRQRPAADRNAEVTVDGCALGNPACVDDVFYQAVTRGGRKIDGLLKGKAVFKSVAQNVASTAFMTALAMSVSDGCHNSDSAEAALIIAGVGLAAGAAAAMTRPEADTRHWEFLPNYLCLLPMDLDPGRHHIEVTFTDAHGKVIPRYTVSQTISVEKGHPVVLLVKAGMRPPTAKQDQTPAEVGFGGGTSGNAP
jgi:hypothetical protein